jgi:hypothetical protein
VKNEKDLVKFAGKAAQEIEELAESKSPQGIVLNLIVELMTETKKKVAYLPYCLLMLMNHKFL